jgi:putative peptidoglycan lipid II flippase
VPLGIVVLPSLSRVAATGRELEFVAMLTRALRLLVYVMIPIGALFAIVREPTVSLLFDDGSYGQAALDLTATTLLAFLFGLAAHALIAVLARAFYARQDTLTPVLAAVGSVVINVTLAILLVEPLGLPGVALAIAIAAWLEASALIIVLRRRVPPFHPTALLGVGLASVVGTVVATGAGLVVLGFLQGSVGTDPGKVALALEIGVTSIAFGLVYAAVSLALRIPELPSIVGVMVDVLRRPRPS